MTMDPFDALFGRRRESRFLAGAVPFNTAPQEFPAGGGNPQPGAWLDDGAITGIAQFASTIRPPVVVAALPALPDAKYPQGSFAFLTTDEKLYRNTDGSTWSVSVDGTDLVAGSVVAGKVAAGAIGTTELAAHAVTADKASFGGSGQIPLTNADFESGTVAGWTHGGSGSLAVTSPAQQGKYAGALARSGAPDSYARNSTVIGVVAGDYLYCSMVAAHSAGAGKGFYFAVDFYDATGALVGSSYLPTFTSLASSARFGQKYGPAPATAVTASLRVLNGSDGTLVFDDVQVVRASALANGPGTVTADDSGLTITGGALTVKNPGGTVIIDGTSDMFKIAATGTLSVAAAIAGASVVVGLGALGTLSEVPACLGYFTIGTAKNISRHMMPVVISPTPGLKYVAASSGGAVTTTAMVGGGYAANLYAYLSADPTGTASVVFYVASTGSTATVYCRYYALAEASI